MRYTHHFSSSASAAAIATVLQDYNFKILHSSRGQLNIGFQNYLTYPFTRFRVGVKLEFVQDLFDSKGQEIFEKFDENLFEIRSIRFDSNCRLESNFSNAGFVRNSFLSIRKFAIRLIRR